MKERDRDWLTSWGYRQYALAPCERWSKLEYGCELEIRACDERERKAYRALLSARLNAPGRRTNVYFGDDAAELDRLLGKEARELWDEAENAKKAETSAHSAGCVPINQIRWSLNTEP